jgi:hypothetical protein
MLNETKFRAIYDDYLESGLTVRDFCSNQHMNEAKFYYWQHRLKGLLPPKRVFVPVVFDKDQFLQRSTSRGAMQNRPMASGRGDGSMGTVGCEIVYPNGVSLKLNGGADLETLRSLLLLAR